MLKRIWSHLNRLYLRALVSLQIFAAQEPVRLRAALTSLVLALAVVFPAIDAGTAETIGAVGVVALPILVGESARRKVTPVE
ncbi:hypothetical protein [Streptomyces sp. SID5910]|uniref:hypothetical protein n=1 Tax=Streptomyces sp. SID5910 TaxID=2690312 RepID=UPI0013711385|nr:hypothetical protein [Streptomyces sp. SID5910]MYR43076.1 hypothetical protein [Streptomyces sp. SID5910]